MYVGTRPNELDFSTFLLKRLAEGPTILSMSLLA
jgi:hypothetical protein